MFNFRRLYFCMRRVQCSMPNHAFPLAAESILLVTSSVSLAFFHLAAEAVSLICVLRSSVWAAMITKWGGAVDGSQIV